MKTLANTILFLMAVVVISLTVAACDGEKQCTSDGTPCVITQDDAGTDTGTPIHQDGGTDVQINPGTDSGTDTGTGDPCANWEWMNGLSWSCNQGTYICNTVVVKESATVCQVKCDDNTWGTTHPEYIQFSADDQQLTLGDITCTR